MAMTSCTWSEVFVTYEVFCSKSCCVTEVFVPFVIHNKSRWANTGLNALQGILKVFHLDVAHLGIHTIYIFEG